MEDDGQDEVRKRLLFGPFENRLADTYALALYKTVMYLAGRLPLLPTAIAYHHHPSPSPIALSPIVAAY